MERVSPSSLPRAARRVVGGAILALLAALALAGCGDTVGYSEGTGDREHGKELFLKGCGSCHTLADAGTTGTIGPNLDYAFLQSRTDGLGEDTIQQVVRGQIAYPITTPSTGAPGMPADIFVDQDAEDVATYVASVAGLDADGDGVPDPGAGSGGTGGGGTGGGGGAADGKALFAANGCGSCHALADANASGTIGPSLDDAKPTKDLVVDRVTNGTSAGMPPFGDKLTAEQIDAIADYVSTAAGS